MFFFLCEYVCLFMCLWYGLNLFADRCHWFVLCAVLVFSCLFVFGVYVVFVVCCVAVCCFIGLSRACVLLLLHGVRACVFVMV